MSSPLLAEMTHKAAYLPVEARILDVRRLTDLEKLFTVALPDGLSLNHAPGQFVELSLFGAGEAPFSISSSPSRSNGTFELCVRQTGRLTDRLHALGPGDTVGIRGPFGKGFPMQRFYGKDLLFLPAGLGLAPLRSLINQVLDERDNFGRVTILYGARNPGELLFREELAEWQARDDVELQITVDRPDPAWQGHVGVITTLIPGLRIHPLKTVAVTVGPPVMYRYVLIELLTLAIQPEDIWVSLERHMKCGIGKCGHCQINGIFTCLDGPCLPYTEIMHLEEAL